VEQEGEAVFGVGGLGGEERMVVGVSGSSKRDSCLGLMEDFE
jgi:hypothetical protein